MPSKLGVGYSRRAGTFGPPEGGFRAPTGRNAEWWYEDIVALVDAALPELAAAGEGHKLKAAAKKRVAAVLNARLRGGAAKSEKGVQQKLTDVLKIYHSVAFLKGLDQQGSGLHWDDAFGANVRSPADENVWDGIVSKHPYCEPFRNVGWDLFDVVAKMRPSKAKGDYVVRAATGEIGANRVGPSSGDPPSRDSTPDATTSAEDGDGGAAASQTVVDSSTQGTVPPATPAPVSRKRSSSSVPASTAKRARTAADSLTALGDRVGEFTEAFREANVAMTEALKPVDGSREALKVLVHKDKAWLDRHGKFHAAARRMNDPAEAKLYLNMDHIGSSPRKTSLKFDLNISDTEPEDEPEDELLFD